MMSVTPARKGFAYAVAVIAGITAIFTLTVELGVGSVPYPSANLFSALAQAGIGLLIAYSITIAAAEKSLHDRSNREDHLSWLGFATGLGVCALIGIGLAFGLAEHRAAGHGNLLDRLGFWWIAASIGLLGLLVAFQPWTSYEWRTLPAKRRWRVERLRARASQSRPPAT